MASKMLVALGIPDFKTYILKYFLPVFLLDALFLFVFLLIFPGFVFQVVGFTIFVIVLISLFAYPMMIVDKKTKDIEENIHYFITYAGALSTVNLERKEFFQDLSNKERYPEIASLFKKLLYLVETIKVDFSTASYKTAGLINSEPFARFFERMGIALSFNAEISKFFLEEQKAIMNSYETIYRESLERIKMFQELFLSLILSYAFVLSTALLIPFLIGASPEIYLQYGVLALFVIDLMMLVFATSFLPRDPLYHSMGYEKGRLRSLFLFFALSVVCVVIAPFVLMTDWTYMVKFAAIATPLLIVGMYANYHEKLVKKRDILFPAFIRSLGNVHQSKGGTLTSTVETLLPHDFGILNDMLTRVYKRLKITSDKFSSWYYFSKESGSALIAEFMDIFVTVVYRGGSSQIAGEIVSDNFARINGLRDQKQEYISTLKGSIYGTYLGLGITIYISLLISMMLFNIFTDLTEDMTGMALDLVEGVFPVGLEADFSYFSVLVAGMLSVHAFFSAYLIKLVDGGNKFSMFTDFVILMWIGAFMDFGVTAAFENLFPNFF